MFRYIWLVPLLPLIGAVVNGLLGGRLRFSERAVGSIAAGSVALAFLLSLAAVYSYGWGGGARWPAPYLTSEDGAFAYTWMPESPVELSQGTPAGAGREAARGAAFGAEWSYQLDPLSSVFMLVVTGVGLCIFVFASGYMRGDPGFYRFFAYLGLFMFMMLVLVMGSNFMMMFVGWEGVGLCSYLLIGYYFDRKEAGDASRKAFVTNRIGDFGLLLAVFAVIAAFGTTQYTEVFERASAVPVEAVGAWGLMSWIALGLFVGAAGKSAQIPLFVWLPDAMAGPTPVSALIHAATMVTAGVYMLTRTNVIFQHSRTMMLVVALVGVLTALLAAAIALTQNDIKKILAYSTVSQLGFMFLACGVGAFVAAVFHVMTHAFFKALMFLGAGSVIHGMHHEQDVRRMGGLRKYMPKTYLTFLVGWLAICGLFPFSGFWSKDEILWGAAAAEYVPGGWALWLLATVAAGGTAFYMTRLVALTFWGRERFLEVRAGGQADEAHAAGYDGGETTHAALTPSVADRPHHGPEERVGVAHLMETEAAGQPEGVDERGHDIHDRHDPREHAHAAARGSVVPHESPASMWVPLAVLAVLAAVGGLVGVGPAFKFLTGGEYPGGRLNITNWLSPVVWNPATGEFGKAADAAVAPAAGQGAGVAGGAAAAGPDGDTGFNLAHAVEHVTHSHALAEWFFITVSLVVAGLGVGLGLLFYVRRPGLPAVWAARLAPLYRASLNKFWVDEFYGAAVTRRVMDAARLAFRSDAKVIDGAVNGAARLARRLSLLTGASDRYVVDGAVNGLAGFVKLLMSPLVRAAQTGMTANYALAMVLGLLAAVVIFFAGDIF
jgi:NADH-quinone oxidoreductase subunit L